MITPLMNFFYNRQLYYCLPFLFLQYLSNNQKYYCFFRDGKLDIDEFSLICRALFRNDSGKIYNLEQSKVRDIFSVFDKNKDGFIDRDEFVFCWNHWIKIVRQILLFFI